MTDSSHFSFKPRTPKVKKSKSPKQIIKFESIMNISGAHVKQPEEHHLLYSVTHSFNKYLLSTKLWAGAYLGDGTTKIKQKLPS